MKHEQGWKREREIEIYSASDIKLDPGERRTCLYVNWTKLDTRERVTECKPGQRKTCMYVN